MSRWPYRYLPGTTVEKLRKELETALNGPSLRTKSGRVLGSGVKSPITRAREVLDVLKRHLDDLGVEPSLIKPLAEIQDAFAEAKRGLRPPLFKSKSLHGAPPIEGARLDVMKAAALAVDWYLAAGKSRQEAEIKVAQALNKMGVPIGGMGPDWKTIRTWRNQLAKVGKLAAKVAWLAERAEQAKETGEPKKAAIWAKLAKERRLTQRYDFFYRSLGELYLEEREAIKQRVKVDGVDPIANAKARLKRIEPFAK